MQPDDMGTIRENNKDHAGRLKPHLIPCLVLLATVCVIYARALGHDFIFNWGDNAYVTGNSDIRGFTREHLKRAFSSFYVGNYAPLHIISYMVDYTLHGMKASGFIFTNILLHALNGLLYYALLIRITGRRIWAFLAAFIFIAHPVQVESVAWISQRKNVLAMFFFLLSCLLYVGYRERDTHNSKFKIQNSKFLYAGSIVAFLAALLAKSVAVVLPFVLLLHDICFLGKNEWRKRLPGKIPYLAVAAVLALVALKSQAPESGGGRVGYHGGSPLATFHTMLPVFVRYLGLLFWPADLSAVYDPPIKTGIDLAVALSAVVVALFCAGGFFLYRRRKDLFFWGALFAVGLLPVSQLVPLVTLMNDRYLYFPMLGGAALFAGAMVSGVDALSGGRRKAMTAAVCLLLASLPLLSYQRTAVWRDSATLWTDAFKKAPNSAAAWTGLGDVQFRAGSIDLALSAYQRALSLAPLDRNALHNISNLHLLAGRLSEAKPYLTKLADNYPNFADGLLTLAYYHYLQGNMREAESVYSRILTLQPDSFHALSYLGHINFSLGKSGVAREFYSKALATGGESPEIHYNMSLIEATAGNKEKALRHAQSALLLGFRDGEALSKHPLAALPEFRNMLRNYQAR